MKIEIADLAIAEIMRLLKNGENGKITIEELYVCGLEVKDRLEKETGKQIKIIVDRDVTYDFIYNYTDIFRFNDNRINLREDKTLKNSEEIYYSYKIELIIEALAKKNVIA